MRYYLLLLLLTLFLTPTFGQVKVILDTDPSADPDDMGCIAMLHNMATKGECEILAMINSTEYKKSSLSISAMNMFYNRMAIPVGDYKGYAEKIESPETNYDYHIAEAYPRKLNTWEEAIDGVALYREVLASAEDNSITVVIIGTMHNFYGLLRSEEDEFSVLNGVDLVKAKVKQVVTMGGNFIDGKGYDRTNWGGAEKLCSYTDWSCINKSRNQMCRYVIKNCPSPFIASGWEVGCGDYYNANYGNVMTGQGLLTLDTTHILRRSYEYHFLTRRETKNITRHSNDQCALHFAIRGESNNYIAYTNGEITLSKKGVCSWTDKTNKQQGYIQKSRDKDLIAEEIEALMMMTPAPMDTTPPARPENLATIAENGHQKLVWSPSPSQGKGKWVVGYHIYVNDDFFKMVHGTQFILDKEYQSGTKLEITAVNASGIESEPTLITFD